MRKQFISGAEICFGLLVAAGSLMSARGFAGEYKYRVIDFPPIAGKICDDYAFAEGQRLKEFVGGNFTVTDARCFQDDIGANSPARWNFDIIYSADSKLDMVSTNDFGAVDRPGFANLKACNAALEAEKALFAKATGLKVFAGFCKTPLYNDMAWEIQVQGFGEPKLRPFITSPNIFGTVVGHTAETFTATIRERMALAHLEMSQLTMVSHMAYFAAAIRYYAAERVDMRSETIAMFADPKFCLTQVAQTKTALDQSGTTNFGVFCIKNSLSSTGSELFTLTNGKGLTLTTPEVPYDTFDICETARPAVVSHYQQQLGRDIKASYCSMQSDGRKFKVIMVERRK